MVCSILLGKLRSVHMGNDCSGGSCDDEYDSIKLSKTTCVLPLVPRVPLSSSGLWKKTQRRSTYVLASTLSRAFVTPSWDVQKSSLKMCSVSWHTRSLRHAMWPTRSGGICWAALAAQSLFIWPTSRGRNRSWRVGLLLSVECMWV